MKIGPNNFVEMKSAKKSKALKRLSPPCSSFCEDNQAAIKNRYSPCYKAKEFHECLILILYARARESYPSPLYRHNFRARLEGDMDATESVVVFACCQSPYEVK